MTSRRAQVMLRSRSRTLPVSPAPQRRRRSSAARRPLGRCRLRANGLRPAPEDGYDTFLLAGRMFV
eukprot:6554771-Alexandrium_andersonii.AAC.1